MREFKRAWEAGDIDALVRLLAADATAVSDGGGRVRSVQRPVVGAERIVRSLVLLQDAFRGHTILEATVNGQPGLISRRDGATVAVYAFEVAGEAITRIWAVRNPDKLRAWTVAPVSGDGPAA
ncbi:hypothetical protein ACFPZ0_14550 [Streptomonospora nanhaiensis]|uniref:SnoaL-like domain-containing protein n=1 Tax=Streptomonospora nanhaiensis TaxID=1323731 RepID=A0A853BVV4_9ACTN|nr:hypothetical protein [Streptomonospora nanhaiensis]MBV2364478.1 hypothetical protein [Streptomonospora nanhaiensis]MBX9390600.1 hypothetical protein [Streptomonospora nanhaiensis]NYI99174.1 hypothetical protein [Streptomonospora nanhaiensis]